MRASSNIVFLSIVCVAALVARVQPLGASPGFAEWTTDLGDGFFHSNNDVYDSYGGLVLFLRQGKKESLRENETILLSRVDETYVSDAYIVGSFFPSDTLTSTHFILNKATLKTEGFSSAEAFNHKIDSLDILPFYQDFFFRLDVDFFQQQHSFRVIPMLILLIIAVIVVALVAQSRRKKQS